MFIRNEVIEFTQNVFWIDMWIWYSKLPICLVNEIDPNQENFRNVQRDATYSELR